MPLVPQQAVLSSLAPSYDLAMSDIERQMDALPDVRIISLATIAPNLMTFRVTVVVETV